MILGLITACGIFAALVGFISYRIRKENMEIETLLAPEAEASQHITTITASFIKQEN